MHVYSRKNVATLTLVNFPLFCIFAVFTSAKQAHFYEWPKRMKSVFRRPDLRSQRPQSIFSPSRKSSRCSSQIARDASQNLLQKGQYHSLYTQMDIQGRIVSAGSDECHSYQFVTQASCCVYVTGSTNLTTRVKSVCEKRLWGVVEIKKCVNCQFELQKWKVVGAMET
ncbi:hypothetical protein AVEN_8639-1 [Araneus ventricosus]|uniref:Uncharacterized protein n=1 Tax=Araneus ventricosus TaxID=182803 RepID=A0A4Y2C342_ARAVE|nr:hypothetical protein AVEN_8639-1 [Araneus ventricosus]